MIRSSVANFPRQSVLWLALAFAPTAARHWTDVVDEDEYKWVDLDGRKAEVVVEADPFLFHGGAPAGAPTDNLLPTPKPTEIWEWVDGNGGCPEGQVLHEVKMVDSWGDGWGGATMTITRLVDPAHRPNVVHKVEGESDTTVSEIVTINEPIGDDPSFPYQVFHGLLQHGKEGFSHVCLQRDQCYEVKVQGGAWESEVSWSIREVQLGSSPENVSKTLVAEGLAPQVCRMSVVDASTGDRACPNTCSTRTDAPTHSSAAPSDMPSLVPSGQPSNENVARLSTMPSDAPSLVPSSNPSGSREVASDLGL